MNESIENHPPRFVDRYPPPDPDWDYYEIWMKLVEAVCEIDQALELIKVEEVGNQNCDFHAKGHVQNALNALKSVDFDDGLAGF